MTLLSPPQRLSGLELACRSRWRESEYWIQFAWLPRAQLCCSPGSTDSLADTAPGAVVCAEVPSLPPHPLTKAPAG